MQWIIFGVIAVLVGLGIRRAWRDALRPFREMAQHAARDMASKSRDAAASQKASPGRQALVKEEEVKETGQCPKCGTYVAVGARHRCPETKNAGEEP